MEQEMLTAMENLFAQAQQKVAEFGKDTYEQSFHDFLEKNAELWKTMTAPCASSKEEDGIRQECEEIAKALAGEADKKRSVETKKSKRDRMQLEYNLFMVSYVLPAIREYYKEQVGPSKQVDVLTEAICQEWAKYPSGGHIEAADYESIKGGFKTKLCFVTTAVCTGLHKPQDCEEIALMKKYRDDYLFQQPDGEQTIQEYYNIAPTIVKRIAKEEKAEEVYQYLWDHYISECVTMAQDGRLQECREKYEDMMTSLKQKYLITNTH